MDLIREYRKTAIALATTALIAAAGPVGAVPVAIGLGGFSGGETVVDFNSVADEQLITSQFAGSGVNFSGAIYGMTNSGDTTKFPANGGGVIASNWLYAGSGKQGDSFTATFGTLRTRVGLYSETNDGDDVTIELFNGATSLGSITFVNTNGLTADFLGLEDTSGFDSAVVTVVGVANHFLAVDDLRFEGAAVPEPGSLALLALGIAGFSAFRRARRS